MQLRDCASVRRWMADYARHWGEHDPGIERNLAILQEFCDRATRSPDQIIDECLRSVEEGTRIRLKTRRRYMASIEEFETNHKLGRTAGNVIRSFLIHNGVAVSANVTGT